MKSLIDCGLVELLVNFDRLSYYWKNMLADLPEHPACGQEHRSVPLSLYGPVHDFGQPFIEIGVLSSFYIPQ